MSKARKYQPLKLNRNARTLLDRAMTAMREHPETVDMDQWVEHDETVVGKEPWCGTSACIAGHIAIQAGCPRQALIPLEAIPKKYRPQLAGNFDYVTPEQLARTLFGLHPDTGIDPASRLFYRRLWPKKFRARYRRSAAPKKKAAAVIARLKHWLKTGE